MAMVVFAIVATGIVGALVSSASFTTLSKERTIAEQGVSNQIEKIRALDYNSVGTTTGNPSGSLVSPIAFNGVNGENVGVPASMTTTVTYASADVPGSAQTGADAKKVVVAITRNKDSKVLARAVTYVAPKFQASQTTGVVQATVTDIGNNTSPSGTVLQNVRVTLTPPTGSPASDVTDASGTATFPGLTPTVGSQTYSVGIATPDVPPLYTRLPVAAFGLSPTEIAPESIQVYQPVTLYVALRKPDGTNWVGTANITVTAGSGGTSYSFNNVNFAAAGTLYTITSQGTGGAPLLPNIDYFVRIQAATYTTVTDDEIVPVAGAYPAATATDLSYTFTETMAPVVNGTLDITATRIRTSGGTVTCQSGAAIQVRDSGGALVASGTTSTSSPYDVQLQVPASVTYTVTATGGGGRTGSAAATPAANPTLTPVPVALNGLSTSGTNC
ncbi:MAG TPA: hypothetical protein VGI77_01245 [Gaiellaceae bacterium]